MFSSKSFYTEDEVSLSFCGVVGLLIREIYFVGYEDQFYTSTFQRGYIKVVTNSPDEILRDLKTLSSYIVKENSKSYRKTEAHHTPKFLYKQSVWTGYHQCQK